MQILDSRPWKTRVWFNRKKKKSQKIKLIKHTSDKNLIVGGEFPAFHDLPPLTSTFNSFQTCVSSPPHFHIFAKTCQRPSTYYEKKTTFWKGIKDKASRVAHYFRNSAGSPLSTERTEVQASTLKCFLMPKLALPTSSDRLSVRELRKQGALLENLFPRETQALPFSRQLFLPTVSKKTRYFPMGLIFLIPCSF